jgi:hypothetical protein
MARFDGDKKCIVHWKRHSIHNSIRTTQNGGASGVLS